MRPLFSYLLIAIFLLIAVVLQGCSPDGVPAESDAEKQEKVYIGNAYFPINEGNQWFYNDGTVTAFVEDYQSIENRSLKPLIYSSGNTDYLAASAAGVFFRGGVVATVDVTQALAAREQVIRNAYHRQWESEYLAAVEENTLRQEQNAGLPAEEQLPLLPLPAEPVFAPVELAPVSMELRIKFDVPLIMLDRTTQVISQSYQRAGAVAILRLGRPLGELNGAASYQVSYIGIETVATPAGEVDAHHVNMDLDLNTTTMSVPSKFTPCRGGNSVGETWDYCDLHLGSQQMRLNYNVDFWFARDIGLVRRETTANSEFVSEQLQLSGFDFPVNAR